MVLPSFIGIGAEKCGSTWLHELLKQHPKIYMPLRRKELDFFNLNYSKGLEWYESFFPNPQDASVYDAIGEISPRYLNFPECASRIATVKSIRKLIVILRNPLNRAYSHYGHIVRLQNYSKSFEEFILDHPKVITNGFYAKNLNYFLQYYSQNQICCIIFEEVVNDIGCTKKKIARFLEIQDSEFPEAAGLKKANETYIPRLKRLNQLSSQMTGNLRNLNLDWIINVARAVGFKKVLRIGSKSLEPMPEEMRSRLQDIYAQDIENLEKLLGINLDLWR